MKPISYKREMEDTERICTWEGPTGSCSVSVSKFTKLKLLRFNFQNLCMYRKYTKQKHLKAGSEFF